MQFLPVFKATSDSQEGRLFIVFGYPTVNDIALTGEAPDGFDGNHLYNHKPPVYPCVVITGEGSYRHVPNRLIRDDRDLERYTVEFFARRVWRYGPEIHEYQKNEHNRRENKNRADRSIADYEETGIIMPAFLPTAP